MSFDAQVFGTALKAAREARRLTQDELAERSGVRSETVSRLERAEGSRQPMERTIRNLASALGLTADELVSGAPAPVDMTLVDRVAALERQLDAVIAALPSLATGQVPGPVESLLRAGALSSGGGSAASPGAVPA